MNVITSNGIEFKESELMEHAMNNQYVVKFKTIFAVKYSQNAGVRLEKLYYSYDKLPLTKRGRFHVMGFAEVNNLLGFELLTA